LADAPEATRARAYSWEYSWSRFTFSAAARYALLRFISGSFHQVW